MSGRLFSTLCRLASAETLPSGPFLAPAREPIADKLGWEHISVSLFPKYITTCRRYPHPPRQQQSIRAAPYRLAVTSISTSLPGVE
jgi:hypothetical protein